MDLIRAVIFAVLVACFYDVNNFSLSDVVDVMLIFLLCDISYRIATYENNTEQN